ncbi:FAD:protein FMN transferase [Jhaorihella thermophila]|uniref:FAD:protein FMN transferase n=1 Tax=Jhaorihella thermophila TaxID=488547 RepID=A0A1H5TK86_9RHOB|nr:FAD:protein FMN transferase [Jhaorihella thermophila]SEF62598.1 thiamine biosynthesis lipoprotein [Jhaorihella thermophila]
MGAVLTRRRFLAISACAVAVPARAGEVARWRGRALGASTSMILTGLTPAQAAPVFAAVERELDRLEAIFSLFREGSEIARLNRVGRLRFPSAEMVAALDLSGRLHRATGGAFDPTVQPLWQALAEGRGPRGAAVGWRHVRRDREEIRFARPGMAITLNGLAQGIVTDRLAALLRGRGLTDLLIDMGEIVALGRRPDGAPWRAGIAAADGRVLKTVRLADRAVATSAPLGTVIGGRGHIIDPRAPGRPAVHATAAVSAPQAAVADGLSTAFCLLDAPAARAVVAAFPGARIEALETA